MWGADVSLADLNLCAETLDGIRNHSWSRPAPDTPEGEVVSWADRIAYVCHDWEDAVSAGIVTPALLPDVVRAPLRRDPLAASSAPSSARWWPPPWQTGRVGMDEDLAEALAAFRRCNYEHVYLRPASVEPGRGGGGRAPGPGAALRRPAQPHPRRARRRRPGRGQRRAPCGRRSAYVAGMTDRFAMALAVSDLGWDPERLPRGIDDLHRY